MILRLFQNCCLAAYAAPAFTECISGLDAPTSTPTRRIDGGISRLVVKSGMVALRRPTGAPFPELHQVRTIVECRPARRAFGSRPEALSIQSKPDKKREHPECLNVIDWKRAEVSSPRNLRDASLTSNAEHRGSPFFPIGSFDEFRNRKDLPSGEIAPARMAFPVPEPCISRLARPRFQQQQFLVQLQ